MLFFIYKAKLCAGSLLILLWTDGSDGQAAAAAEVLQGEIAVSEVYVMCAVRNAVPLGRPVITEVIPIEVVETE